MIAQWRRLVRTVLLHDEKLPFLGALLWLLGALVLPIIALWLAGAITKVIGLTPNFTLVVVALFFLAYLAVMPIACAAMLLICEGMWMSFGIYRLFDIKSWTIRDGIRRWARYESQPRSPS